MSSTGTNSPISTYFAPAERSPREVLERQRRQLLASPLARAMLDSIPDMALVINQTRQVVAANQVVATALALVDDATLLGRRPGELIGCIHAADGPGGCGTSRECAVCGALGAVLEAIQTGQTCRRECRLLTDQAPAGALDLAVHATGLTVDGDVLLLVVLKDISEAKRREVLERIFFHDLLNTAGGIRGLAELLRDGRVPADAAATYQDRVFRLADRIVDEINAHRMLQAAEQGELQPTWDDVSVGELLQDAVETYRHHAVANRRQLTLEPVEPMTIRTDPLLFRRVVGNLIKNALEAVDPGQTVVLQAHCTGGRLNLLVHNPGHMAEEVQQQVFQRSFSTKPGAGRGIGTYSIRLFIERYLGGQVGFVSEEDAGTTFFISLPTDPFDDSDEASRPPVTRAAPPPRS